MSFSVFSRLLFLYITFRRSRQSQESFSFAYLAQWWTSRAVDCVNWTPPCTTVVSIWSRSPVNAGRCGTTPTKITSSSGSRRGRATAAWSSWGCGGGDQVRLTAAVGRRPVSSYRDLVGHRLSQRRSDVTISGEINAVLDLFDPLATGSSPVTMLGVVPNFYAIGRPSDTACRCRATPAARPNISIVLLCINYL